MPAEEYKNQDPDLVFSLDIGTRSVIGMVGRLVGERFKVLAIEKEEHGKRAMLDGQIDDIGQVAGLARAVTRRLESKLGVRLSRVSVAAAGRALRTERAGFALELDEPESIGDEHIRQLEAGAVSAAEASLQGDDGDGHRQFFLVGYTSAQYRLDRYPMTTLKGHNGKLLEAEVVATFLPSEVVESLYAAMRLAELRVVSMTLEPIAAMNAVIPADLRLLNLVLVDIGAGTSDIAVCKDGSVVGYTMVTLAGDEITEALMKAYLVDFKTAERIKHDLAEREEVQFTDILGLGQTVAVSSVYGAIEGPLRLLAEAVAKHVLEVNGGPPSALFLAGGGSKLAGLQEQMAECLGMDRQRVAVAGNNFDKSAFSDEYDLNDPEYATPLGIAVSAGMDLISDSYVVQLNGQRTKLFRSGLLTLQEVLFMNGYTSADLIGRTGQSLAVTVDGRRMVFRGEPGAPAVLRINGEDVSSNAIVQAGDHIDFVPAMHGAPAFKTLGELLGTAFSGEALVNNQEAGMEQPLHSGDVILTVRRPVPAPRREERRPETEEPPQPAPTLPHEVRPQSPVEPAETHALQTEPPRRSAPIPHAEYPQPSAAVPRTEPPRPSAPIPHAEYPQPPAAVPRMEPPRPSAPISRVEYPQPAAPAPQAERPRPPLVSAPTLNAPPQAKTIGITLNGEPMVLEAKEDGMPHYLMDLLQFSGIDFEHLDRPVLLQVNGEPCMFRQVLRDRDSVVIRCEEDRGPSPQV